MKNLIKNAVGIVLMTTLLFTFSVNGFASELNKVKVNGKELILDVAPTMVEGRMLVPLRAIFEELDAIVEWEAGTRTVNAYYGEIKIQLQINNKISKINQKEVSLDVPAKIIGGRTLVPMRFVSESLGAYVEWFERSKTAMITSVDHIVKYDNGEYMGENKNGEGTFIWTSGEFKGDKYVGEFKDAKRNGHGTYTRANGDIYVGEFKDGLIEGQGTETYSDGDQYVGQWKADHYNGYGAYTFSNGDQYIGEFKDNLSEGYGTYTWANGDEYVGEFKEDLSEGKGTETYANGDQYVGEWKADNYNGYGTYTYATGDQYVGEWKDGKKNGQGTYTFKNGDKNVGEWKEDQYLGNQK